MPERQCVGCTRQAEWGCEAFKYETTKETKGARKARDGRFYAWHKPALYPLDIEGEQTWACPRQDLKNDPRGWSKLLFFYDHYQNGFLPQTGSVVDQSMKAMELFRVLTIANADVDKAQDDAKKRRQAMNERLQNQGPQKRQPPPRGR